MPNMSIAGKDTSLHVCSLLRSAAAASSPTMNLGGEIKHAAFENIQSAANSRARRKCRMGCGMERGYHPLPSRLGREREKEFILLKPGELRELP